jgi:hypothetical protein
MCMQRLLVGGVALALLTICILAPGLAVGCDVCFSVSGNPFALPHPRALEIAVATRSALEKGLLTERETKNVGWSRTPRRASGLEPLNAWLAKKNAGKATTDGGPASLHIVLIDTSEAVALHFRSGAVLLDSKPSGSGDAVIATTSHGLRALLSGELSLDRALTMKLLIVEGRPGLIDTLVIQPTSTNPPSGKSSRRSLNPASSERKPGSKETSP